MIRTHLKREDCELTRSKGRIQNIYIDADIDSRIAYSFFDISDYSIDSNSINLSSFDDFKTAPPIVSDVILTRQRCPNADVDG